MSGLASWPSPCSACGPGSRSLKHAFAVGIGLFLALIGLYETGIITSAAAGMPPAALIGPAGLLRAPNVPLRIGDPRDPRVLLAVFGLLLTAVLLQRKVPGALLLGIAATAALGAAAGYGEAPKALAALPFTGDLSLTPLFLKVDVAGVLRLAFLPALLTLVIMGLLNTRGTLAGLRRGRGPPRREGPVSLDREADDGGRVELRLRRARGNDDERGLHRVRHGDPRGGAHRPGGGHHGRALRRQPVLCAGGGTLQRLRYAYAPAPGRWTPS